MASPIFVTMDPGSDTVASVDQIRLAYRMLFGREADASGLEHFTRMAQTHALDIAKVAAQLIRSDEFALRHGLELPPVEIDLGGYSMFARSSDRDIGAAIAAGYAYEPHVTALVRRELKPGGTFLDVGANIGYFSMLGAHLVGPSGKVLAVEPLDKNLQLIYAGIERNGFLQVEVMPFGASDAARLVPMVTDPGTSNALVQTAPSSKRIAAYAPMRPLDWLTTDLQRIDLMKIDIEGHELFAWRGAQRMLARHRPKIITEFHPGAMRENAGVEARDYLSALFTYAHTVKVLFGTNETVPCVSTDEVFAQWRRSDERYGGRGTSHLDLFVVPDD